MILTYEEIISNYARIWRHILIRVLFIIEVRN